jgi:hypothetical protein
VPFIYLSEDAFCFTFDAVRIEPLDILLRLVRFSASGLYRRGITACPCCSLPSQRPLHSFLCAL